MTHTTIQHRLTLRAYIVIAALVIQGIPTATAQSAGATYEIRPHCDVVQTEDDWLFGEIPTAGFIANTGDGRCDKFDVENPETLRTDPLSVGDTVDMDILIHNPEEQPIKRARAWLSYDPNILEGVSIELNQVEPYWIATPGEEDFDEDNGYAMMELSSEVLDEPSNETLVFARVQFRVVKATPTGTVISFHDVQPNGHTEIVTRNGETDVNALEKDPGTLHIVMADASSSVSQSSESVVSSSSSSTVSSSSSSSSTAPAPISSSSSSATTGNELYCNVHADCPANTMCISGICQEDPNALPNGASCTVNEECQSNLCSGGICIPETTTTADTTSRTAFALLQVQNVRVTTEGSSIFLAWDALTSSQLKAYNVYYGTTSGRYIQLRTVPGTSQSITLRSLPIGTTYYLAVRAVSTIDEESAFSQEVAVTVGDPGSSTAPLDPTTLGATITNPLGNTGPGTTDVPGETGLPSVLLIALLLSGALGTLMASRRQASVQLSS